MTADYKHLAERLGKIRPNLFSSNGTEYADRVDMKLIAECISALHRLSRVEEAARAFAEPHAMGDNYVSFAPRLIEALRTALAEGGDAQPREMDLQDVLFGGAKPVEEGK